MTPQEELVHARRLRDQLFIETAAASMRRGSDFQSLNEQYEYVVAKIERLEAAVAAGEK